MMCSRGPCTQHACKDVGELWMLGLVHWRMCTGALAWIRILLTTRDTLVELITLSSLLEYTLYFVECMMSCCLSVSTIHGQSWIMLSCTPRCKGFRFLISYSRPARPSIVDHALTAWSYHRHICEIPSQGNNYWRGYGSTPPCLSIVIDEPGVLHEAACT